MSFETDFRTALLVAGVTNLVPSTRITASKRVQAADLPAITYERITSNPQQSIAGDDTGLDQVRMRINCWADDYKESRQIFDAVRVAMRSLTSYFILDQDLYEDDTKIYRVAADFYIWTR